MCRNISSTEEIFEYLSSNGVLVRRGMIPGGVGDDGRDWRGRLGLNWGRVPGARGWAGGNLLRNNFTTSRSQRAGMGV